jgi:hypothetical protein
MNAGARYATADLEFRSSGSGLSDRETRRLDVLTSAEGAGRGPVEAVSLPEDKRAAETLGRLHAEPLNRPPERAGNVGKVIGDLLLRDPDEARKLVGGAWALTEVAKERFTDGHRTLRRWAVTSWPATPPGYRIQAEDGRRHPRQDSACPDRDARAEGSEVT